MTNREAHEEAAGMSLDDMFFEMMGLDPDAEYNDDKDKSDDKVKEIKDDEIFNSQKVWPANYNECLEYAKKNGYKYINFNGSVYSIDDMDMKNPLNTDSQNSNFKVPDAIVGKFTTDDIKMTIEDPEFYTADDREELTYIKHFQDKGILLVRAIKNKCNSNKYIVNSAESLIINEKNTIIKSVSMKRNTFANECISKFLKYKNDINAFIINGVDDIKNYTNSDKHELYMRITGYWMYNYPYNPIKAFLDSIKNFDLYNTTFYDETLYYLEMATHNKIYKYDDKKENSNVSTLLSLVMSNKVLSSLYLNDSKFRRIIDTIILELSKDGTPVTAEDIFVKIIIFMMSIINDSN